MLPRLALLFGALTLSACFASAHGYVVAESEPVYVDSYPHTYYEGHTVYLIDDRWYRRHRGRWVYYQDEPEPLHRYRLQVRFTPRSEQGPRYQPRERARRPEWRREAPPAHD